MTSRAVAIALLFGGLACAPATSSPDGGPSGGADSATDDASPPAPPGASSGGAPDATTGRSSDSSLPASSSGSSSGSAGTGTDAAHDAPGVSSGPEPPSCLRPGLGRTNCGDGGESCCASLEVAGGTFDRTYFNDGTGASQKADPATVSRFRFDKYLVTVGRFREFVAAWNAGWVPPAGSGKHTHLNAGRGLVDVGEEAGVAYEPGWRASDDTNLAPTTANLTTNCNEAMWSTWTASPGADENLPINCVSWYDAYAFCIWDGGFLPTETEWQYAAGGGAEMRQFPWGSAAPGTDCPGTGCEYMIYGCYYPSGPHTIMVTGIPGGPPGGVGVVCAQDLSNVAPVGSAPLGVGKWGQLDLSGETYEWTSDTYAPYVDPCVDCANLSDGYRVQRGGCFGSTYDTTAWGRTGGCDPTFHGWGDGVRCARAP